MTAKEEPVVRKAPSKRRAGSKLPPGTARKSKTLEVGLAIKLVLKLGLREDEGELVEDAGFLEHIVQTSQELSCEGSEYGQVVLLSTTDLLSDCFNAPIRQMSRYLAIALIALRIVSRINSCASGLARSTTTSDETTRAALEESWSRACRYCRSLGSLRLAAFPNELQLRHAIERICAPLLQDALGKLAIPEVLDVA